MILITRNSKLYHALILTFDLLQGSKLPCVRDYFSELAHLIGRIKRIVVSLQITSVSLVNVVILRLHCNASFILGDSTSELIRSAEDVDLEHKLRVNSLNGRRPVKTTQEIVS